jgi:hypothetical protein
MLGSLRLIRKFRIFFAVLFAIEYFLGNQVGQSVCMLAYLITLYLGHDVMERTFVAALDEGDLENANGTGAAVGRPDEPQARPGKKDEPEGGSR